MGLSVMERFVRECQHSTFLNHPNIVRFMGIYFPKKSSGIIRPIMVVELMDESLYNYVKNLPKNAWMKKGSILVDVAEGLSYLMHRNQLLSIVTCHQACQGISY